MEPPAPGSVVIVEGGLLCGRGRKMANLAGGLKRRRSCELCNAGAAVYCEADRAFLCWGCDARVHGANFLVARHVRWVACAACHSLDPDRLLAGAGSSAVRSLCFSCGCVDGEGRSASCSGLSSAASATSASGVSTAESGPPAAKETVSGASSGGGGSRRRAGVSEAKAKAEEVVLENWSRRLGGGTRRWAEVASRVVRRYPGGMAGLPPRVGLSAALWFAMKRYGGGVQRAVRPCEAGALRKLEACSGVPATVIVAAESRISRVARKVGSMEEGWGEC